MKFNILIILIFSIISFCMGEMYIINKLDHKADHIVETKYYTIWRIKK